MKNTINGKRYNMHAVMTLAHALLKDRTNDLDHISLALKCAWSMVKANVCYTPVKETPVTETPVDYETRALEWLNVRDIPETDDNIIIAKLYGSLGAGYRYIVRGGGKNAVSAWFDHKMNFTEWYNLQETQDSIVNTAWLVMAKRDIDIPVAITIAARAVYMFEFNIHNLTRDIVGRDGIIERKRVFTNDSIVSITAGCRKNANGDDYNIYDTIGKVDEYDNITYELFVQIVAHDNVDIDIIRYMNYGLTQKQVAERLNVSTVAICKRVKRMRERWDAELYA